MESNLLSHAGIEATVMFDARKMQLVGTIESSAGEVDIFSAYSVDDLNGEYKRVAALVKQREKIREDLTSQMFSLSAILESGEAKIYINKAHSDQHIGMTLKALLEMADGAGFIIQEQLPEQP